MGNNNLNIVILGANFYGIMAKSQRVKNLFEPLLNKKGVKVSNLIVNPTEEPQIQERVSFKTIYYSLKNPFSLFSYYIKAFRYIKEQKLVNSKNILYGFVYPSIENWLILKYAKKQGYYIVFDIVEKLAVLDLSKASIRNKLKWYTAKKMQNMIPQLGSVCFAISFPLIDYCNEICKDKIPVVHLPISVNVNYVHSFKQEKSKDHNKIRIFYGGSFGNKDGIPLLIKGFELAVIKGADVELYLTGKVSRQMEDSLFSLINNSLAHDRIYYLGCLSIEDYFNVMANSDILCMLRVGSNFANTGFPFKLGEYLASENTVLATKVSDIAYYLKHEESAYLINPDTEQEISDAICELALNSSLRQKIAFNGYNTVKEYFDADKVANILYEELMMM